MAAKRFYIEESLKDHPRVEKILSRFQEKEVIYCHHYGEVFNVRSQNFRLQKNNQAIILAKKQGKYALPTPPGFGIGAHKNYYFSHLLNCVYDCRYCFLQGLYPSAHLVLFVNYEDFFEDIADKIKSHKEESTCFFSGYDSDSLAFEGVSGFFESCYDFFRQHPSSLLELRTKSIHVGSLLKKEPLPHMIVAFSFTPQELSQRVEHGVPLFSKRIKAIKLLAERGWKVGLRLDPLIDCHDFEEVYRRFLHSVCSPVVVEKLHSVSVGVLRFPDKIHKKIRKLYPGDPLLAEPLESRDKVRAYEEEREKQMKQTVRSLLTEYMEPEKIFECRYE